MLFTANVATSEQPPSCELQPTFPSLRGTRRRRKGNFHISLERRDGGEKDNGGKVSSLEPRGFLPEIKAPMTAV